MTSTPTVRYAIVSSLVAALILLGVVMVTHALHRFLTAKPEVAASLSDHNGADDSITLTLVDQSESQQTETSLPQQEQQRKRASSRETDKSDRLLTTGDFLATGAGNLESSADLASGNEFGGGPAGGGAAAAGFPAVSAGGGGIAGGAPSFVGTAGAFAAPAARGASSSMPGTAHSAPTVVPAAVTPNPIGPVPTSTPPPPASALPPVSVPAIPVVALANDPAPAATAPAGADPIAAAAIWENSPADDGGPQRPDALAPDSSPRTLVSGENVAGDVGTLDVGVSQVPSPSTVALVALGLALVGLWAHRRSRSR